jgi:hypothetical protein
MKLRGFRSSAYVLLVVVIAATSASAKEGKVSIEELVSKHLQSIGKTTEPTSAPRLLQGRVVFSEIIGRNVHLEGASSVLSQGRKFKCSFQFGTKCLAVKLGNLRLPVVGFNSCARVDV